MMNERPSILIVDDDEGMRRTLELIFGRKGYEVETVGTGKMALEKAQQGPFNVALLDIRLPDMKGVALLEPLSQMQPDMALIMVTAHASVETAAQAVNEGATAYITKPLDVDEVLAQIEDILEKQRLIEDKRRAERELRELNASLEREVEARTAEVVAEKEKVDTILRSVSDAIVMTDEEGRLQYANPALTTLTGYTAQEVVGRPMDLLFEERAAEPTQSVMRSILEEGRAWRGEARGRRKSGRLYDAALSIDPIRDAEGNLLGHVVSFWDVSEEKALERARSRFLTNVSHQFRTPVTTLNLQLTLMQGLDLSEEDRERLEAAREEIGWLIQLIEDVIDVAELDSGRGITAYEPVSLPALIESVEERYRRRADASSLSLELKSMPTDPPEVRGDPRWLTRALSEVMENAMMYTPPGGRVTLTLDTVSREGKTWAIIEVQDEGPGIPAEEHERIFDRFFRGTVADSGHTPGIGLGLSIVQAVMHAHGGRVTVESGEAGSTFRLWLPVVGS